MKADKRIDMAAVIKKYGEQARRAGGQGGALRRIHCDICGKWIWEDKAGEAEFIETKRGAKMFFHRKCLERMRNGQKSE